MTSPCASATPSRCRAAPRSTTSGRRSATASTALSHAPGRSWESEEGTVAEADVTYTRKDGATVTVPVVTIYRENGELIDDYRVFIDLAPLFA